MMIKLKNLLEIKKLVGSGKYYLFYIIMSGNRLTSIIYKIYITRCF